MNKLLFILSLIVISGCSASPMITTGARIVVAGYCAIPDFGRKVVRYEVTEVVAPNKIEITCVGDFND